MKRRPFRQRKVALRRSARKCLCGQRTAYNSVTCSTCASRVFAFINSPRKES